MTDQEALETLGLLAPGARISTWPTAKEIRAAYRAKIKVHKPERDPQMFQRIREALEHAEAVLVWREQTASAREAAAVDLSSPAHDAASPTPPTPWLAQLRHALVQATDPAEQRRLLLAAGAAHPESPELCWWLVRLHQHEGDASATARELERGHALGAPGFLEALALQFPLRIRPVQLAELAGRAPLIASDLFLGSGDLDDAMEAFERSVRQASSLERPLPRRPVVQLGIRAMASGATELGLLVREVVFTRPELLEGPPALVEELKLRELSVIADRIRPELLAAIASDLRSGHIESGDVAGLMGVRANHERFASSWRAIAESSPQLHALFEPSRRPPVSKWIVAVLAIALVCVRVFSVSGCRHHEQRSYNEPTTHTHRGR